MDLEISLLDFNFAMIYIIHKFFAMIYIIHKFLVLMKNHLNYRKDNFFKYFFKKYNRLLFFKKVIFL